MSKLPNTDCVVRVGDGRGFLIEHRQANRRPKDLPKGITVPRVTSRRLIVTAAHCLPHFPPAHAASSTEERTFAKLLSGLGAKPNVWCECLFVDPIADIAILGCPDDQALPEEAEAFEALLEQRTVLPIAKATSGAGWMMTLQKQWVELRIERRGGLEIDPTSPGQSGSPILDSKGRAVGVIAVGTESGGHDRRSGPQPILTENLPGWLFSTLNAR